MEDGEITISGLDEFYNEFNERKERGITSSEKKRVIIIRRVLSLCLLMSKYGYFPSNDFFYLTNNRPNCPLLIHIPPFSLDGSPDILNGFIHFSYSAQFFTDQSESRYEDVYLRECGLSQTQAERLKSRKMSLEELCKIFKVDMSESLLLYRRWSKSFEAYKEDECIKHLASVLWASYVTNTQVYEDEVSGVSIERRMVICVNLARYLLCAEFMFADNVDESEQMTIMTLMVISRDIEHFPKGFNVEV